MQFNDFEAVVRSTAAAFRLGMEGQGSEGLVALIDALPGLLKSLPVDFAVRLNQLLATMLAAQGRKDYLYLADLLEYELLGFLSADASCG